MTSGGREKEELLTVAVDVKSEHPRIQEWLMAVVPNDNRFQVVLDAKRRIAVLVTTARLDADN